MEVNDDSGDFECFLELTISHSQSIGTRLTSRTFAGHRGLSKALPCARRTRVDS